MHRFNYPKKAHKWCERKEKKSGDENELLSLLFVKPDESKSATEKINCSEDFFSAFPCILHLSLSRRRMNQTFKLELYKAPESLTRKDETQERVEGVHTIDTDLMSVLNGGFRCPKIYSSDDVMA